MSTFRTDEARAVLARTPATLDALLRGLPDPWIEAPDGDDGWTPHEVVGHLIIGERTDWITRARSILEHGEADIWKPFDRFAQQRECAGLPLDDLLDEFAELRAANLEAFDALGLDEERLALRGVHPAFGSVSMEQLMATWVAHDLGHIAQIVRAMAGRYREAAGPWTEYLPILAPKVR